tara:strand:+ start:83 stop:775 length:693 start_codon:yes stop_codon:yes gene_type:complete
MTQFKEKAGGNKENASVGLYVYPTLMASDILLYDTTHVPVGNDQKQHLEITRDIAKKFNNDFNCDGFLKIPEPFIQKEFSRIMSLKDGNKKMSKSDESDLSRINLKDSKDVIINKIKKAKTDSLLLPSNKEELKKRPELENLIGMYCNLSEEKIDKVISKFEGKNFSALKVELSDLIIEKICPIGDKINKLLKEKDHLMSILKKGSERAEVRAAKKLNEINEKVGFLNIN